MANDVKPGQRAGMWAICALIGAGGVLASYHYGPKTAKVSMPITQARVADFAVAVRARGEMRSVRSDIVTAPQVPDLRIVHLAESGKAVKDGDVVVEFEIAPEETAAHASLPRRALNKSILRAPHDGILSVLPNLRNGAVSGSATPPFKPGDRVWTGAAVAEIADLSKMRLELKLDEVDRGKVQLKQLVRVRLDAVPDREFTAKLDWISPIASIAFKGLGLTEKTFLAYATLQQTDARLKPGMPGTAEIVIESLRDQLLIPIRASFSLDGKPAVYLQKGDEFVLRPIEVGKRNDTDLVVLNGLKEGETVALEDPADAARRARKLQ
jgi:multidrug efflux pump subunit AcrA (membrane-fusion protein)